MIEPEDVPPHLLYEWFPLSRQDIADVLNDESKYAESSPVDPASPPYPAA